MEKVEIGCRKIYIDLVQFLEKSQGISEFQGLLAGKWGVVLYLFYYEQFCDPSQNNAVRFLQQLYENIDANFDQNYNYCTGLTGPFWMLHHLTKHGFLALDMEHISSDFISGAILQSNYFITDTNFDFLHGSAGICNLLVAFADREEVKEHLGDFVNHLKSSSVETDNGLSFPFFYYQTSPAVRPGTDAFGLAHGTCALQIILMKIHHAGIEQEMCEQLILQSMNFILRHEKVGEHRGSLFPAYLDGKASHSRVSWCYGDLNVAVALWQCGKYFNNETWKEKAIEIFRYNTKRMSRDSSGVIDICLCHGTAGNAAMYMRMLHETKDPLFAECANDWYEATGKMLQFSEDRDVCGVSVYQGKDDNWQFRWSLLEGSAGAGLALISQLKQEPLPWDEFMLLS